MTEALLLSLPLTHTHTHTHAHAQVPRQELNHGRRLRLNIDKEGVIVSLGNSPPGLFKFAVETLLGKNITDVVDIFYQ